MDLSILVVNWNTRDLLVDCLQSVHDTLQGLQFELLVVDNASTDGSVAMVREKFPTVRLIENQENVGFARASNQAIDHSRGRYVMLLNSDARLMGDAAQQIVHFLDTHPRTGIVGARLISPEGDPQVAYGPLPTLMSEVVSLLGMDKGLASAASGPACGQTTAARPALETGWVGGACLTARRQTLEEIGLLDEQFFMFSEEVDLCRRATSAGWDVVHLPWAEVIHVGAGSTGPTSGRYLMLYQAKLRYFAKHHGALARRVLLWAMWLTTWLKRLSYTFLQRLGLDREQKILLWDGVARGLAGLRS
jgi:GT2 family glycosyltransferase